MPGSLPFPVPPPLVLLPGTLCDGRVFEALIASLRLRFPSLSATVLMTAQYASLSAAAEEVLRMAPARFALLGFSLGGMVALEAALLAPDRVLGLALLNTNAAPAPANTHAARRAAVQQAATMGHAAYVRRHLWPSYVAASATPDLALQELVSVMAQDLGHPAFANQTEAALTRRDYRPLLPHLTMPVLVQAGEQDAVCPADNQRRLAQALPRARFDLIAGAGHFALLEKRDSVAASVAGWFHTLLQQPDPAQESQ